MRILFILLSVLLLAVGLGWMLQKSSGGVVFTYADWTIQTSLVVFVLLFVILFILVYVVIPPVAEINPVACGFSALVRIPAPAPVGEISEPGVAGDDRRQLA